jgi:Ser/Thr protein kinase RdoA (MazF antagonist)
VTEEPLAGGNNTHEVVRIGATVRRSRGDRAPFATQVLTYLESVGYPYAPRHLGIDERGRDILTFIPGHTSDHPGQRAPGAFGLAGRMLSALHRATAGHPLAAGAECVLHGDPGPFNTIFDDGQPVAFIDWDSCRPGDRLDDLGYLAWTWCIQSVGNIPVTEQARHLRELRDGYGEIQAEQLLDAITRMQLVIVTTETANLDNPGLSAARRQHAQAAVAWASNDHELIERHRDLLLTALR